MKAKRAFSNKKHPFIFAGIIVVLLAFLAWKAYTLILLKSIAPVEISDNPVKYNISTAQKKDSFPRNVDRSNITPKEVGNGFVAIPELGIKLKLSEELKGLVYYPVKNNLPTSVRISTASLSNSGNYCVASQAPLGSYTRVNLSDTGTRNSGHWMYKLELLEKYSQEWLAGKADITPVKKFENFYIIFEGPQSICLDTDDKVFIEELMQQLKSIKESFSSIEQL